MGLSPRIGDEPCTGWHDGYKPQGHRRPQWSTRKGTAFRTARARYRPHTGKQYLCQELEPNPPLPPLRTSADDGVVREDIGRDPLDLHASEKMKRTSPIPSLRAGRDRCVETDNVRLESGKEKQEVRHWALVK